MRTVTACLAAINVALYDAIARGFGVRVCDLIGGCAVTRIPAYASTGFFSNRGTATSGAKLSSMRASAHDAKCVPSVPYSALEYFARA